MQAAYPPRPHPPLTETKIFTVYQDDANQEIAYRQHWGWRLVGTAARSYTNNLAYTGASYGTSIQASAGQITGTTHHKTDLTFQRILDARGQRLRQLQSQYEAAESKPVDTRVWTTVALGVGGLVGILIVSAFVGAIIAAATSDAVASWTMLPLIAVAIFALVRSLVKLHRGGLENQKRHLANQQLRQRLWDEAETL